MAKREEVTVLIDDAELAFRNFEGAKKQFNAEGDRNFCIILPADVAHDMEAHGWNIKHLKPREDDDGNTPPEGTPYIQVSVKYDGYRPPRVVMRSSRGNTEMTEDTVELLDYVEIAKADLIVRAYDWEVNGNTGRKAYLKTLYLTIDEDELMIRYAQMDAEQEELR